MRNLISVFIALSIAFFSCNTKNTLPVYGNRVPVMVNGAATGDSTDYTIPDFSFVDQNHQQINRATVQDKIFVTEFFFTSCPSICPKMQQQMLRVYEKYKNNNQVQILAFTIDPARDTVGKLKQYEKKLGIESNRWHLLTGNKDSIYSLAQSFLVSAGEDPDAPGGHVHSGNFILVDKKGRLRGYYDGTKEESVSKLLDEMDELLAEK